MARALTASQRLRGHATVPAQENAVLLIKHPPVGPTLTVRVAADPEHAVNVDGATAACSTRDAVAYLEGGRVDAIVLRVRGRTAIDDGLQ
jgi:hypothetical protein